MKLRSIYTVLFFVLCTSSYNPARSQNIDSLLQSCDQFEAGRMSEAKFIDGIAVYWATYVAADVETMRRLITSANIAYYHLGYALRNHRPEEAEKYVRKTLASPTSTESDIAECYSTLRQIYWGTNLEKIRELEQELIIVGGNHLRSFYSNNMNYECMANEGSGTNWDDTNGEWKVKYLEHLKKTNPEKYQKRLDDLKKRKDKKRDREEEQKTKLRKEKQDIETAIKEEDTEKKFWAYFPYLLSGGYLLIAFFLLKWFASKENKYTNILHYGALISGVLFVHLGMFAYINNNNIDRDPIYYSLLITSIIGSLMATWMLLRNSLENFSLWKCFRAVALVVFIPTLSILVILTLVVMGSNDPYGSLALLIVAIGAAIYVGGILLITTIWYWILKLAITQKASV